MSCAEQMERKRRELEDLRAQHHSIQRRWEELWRPCGFAPLEPEAMAVWLDSHRALCQLVERVSHLTGEIQTMTEHIASYEGRLRAALDGKEGDGLSLLVAARQRVDAASETERRRRDLESEVCADPERGRRDRGEAGAASAG